MQEGGDCVIVGERVSSSSSSSFLAGNEEDAAFRHLTHLTRARDDAAFEQNMTKEEEEETSRAREQLAVPREDFVTRQQSL